MARRGIGRWRVCWLGVLLLWWTPATAAVDDAGPIGDALVEAVLQPFTGDLDGLKGRRLIRVLTAYSPTHYTIRDGVAEGLVAEAARGFEEYVNEVLDGPFVSVVVLTAPREKLFDWLLDGHGDVAAANLTVTPERATRVAFSDAFRTDVKEQVVLGPSAPEVADLDALATAGVALHVRAGSSYAEHLGALNATRTAAGTPPLHVVEVGVELHDEDLLELIAAGTIAATVVDDHKLGVWLALMPELRAPEGLVVATDGHIAWAVRPDNPDLLALVNSFVPTAKKGSLHGNMALKRHLQDADRLRNVMDDRYGQRLTAVIEHLQRHGDAYGFDWLLLGAQGFQESRLDPHARSPRGAIGIMQLLPTTAREPYIGLPDIERPEVNIEAGAKYNRWLMDTYLNDPAIGEADRMLFALAAYNAGPGNLQKARRRAVELNLDPNRWFDHVETAMAQSVSREPVVYVRNIYKYYTAYRLYAERFASLREPSPG